MKTKSDSDAKTKLKITYRKVGDLIPYINNAKLHPEEQVNQIAASIKEFGFNDPIAIDGENGIIAGHGRLQAAIKLKIKQVPTIELSHLSETEKKAYIIAHNKLTMNSGYDMEVLSNEMHWLNDAGFDMELTGFVGDELEEFFTDIDFEPGTEEEQGKLDELDPKMVECPHCGEGFDSRGTEIK